MSRKKKLRQEKAPPRVTIPTDHALPWLFAGTLFLSATLLFWVEPMMAKMILPLLGGSPSVWNTCIVFFQAVLLAGYAYAHASAAWLSLRHQLLLHMALVVVPVIALPLGVTEDWIPPTDESPVVWLLLLLSVSVGLPFFILSATTPLLQRWFASTGHPTAKDPYFLYAASNLGSMLALLGYPTIIEPLLPVKKEHWLSQCWLWTLGYGLLSVLIFRCAWVVGKPLNREDQPEHNHALPDEGESSTFESAPRPGILTRFRWVALAFVPSTLMLGVTTYITLDVAAIPLLWVIPLALYLLSFILVFARWPRWLHHALILLQAPLLLLLVFQMQSEMSPRIGMLVFFHLLVLFVVALVCHGELALSRPAPRYLTEFYLWLSVGGALGGLFNALLAPAIFFGVAEYELGLVLACLVLPIPYASHRFWFTRWLPAKLTKPVSILGEVVLAFVVGFLTYKLFQFFIIKDVEFAWMQRFRDELRDNYFVTLGKPFGLLPPEVGVIFVFGLPLLFCYSLAARPLSFLLASAHALGISVGRLLPAREPLLHYLYVRRPLLLGLGIGTIMLNGLFWQHVSRREPVLAQERNFYGVLKVTLGQESGQSLLKLTNGTTLHGVQLYHRDPKTEVITLDREPLSYYDRSGPIGQVFAEFSGPKAKKNVAVIGLGTGTLASYGEQGQSFMFFDIDNDVVKIATSIFTFLKDCRAEWRVIPGDARLRIKLAEEHEFQLIIVDAFNSDAIPIHLLTREAIELYFQKLSQDGILALHISNRYLDLEPVLGNLSQALGLVGLFQYDRSFAGHVGKRASQWVLLAHRKEDFGKLAEDARWKPIRKRPEVGVWTDDYSNLLSVFKWK
ncbi:MAG TPA: fused MFS/spermidine synthase [Gemmataceae bacterium]|nr:fused MFS/spermidine synthase [Gemmataceae bacterium]